MTPLSSLNDPLIYPMCDRLSLNLPKIDNNVTGTLVEVYYTHVKL